MRLSFRQIPVRTLFFPTGGRSALQPGGIVFENHQNDVPCPSGDRRCNETDGFFYCSAARGAVASGILICILPAVAGADAVWFAMPVTELLAAVYVVLKMVRYTKAV